MIGDNEVHMIVMRDIKNGSLIGIGARKYKEVAEKVAFQYAQGVAKPDNLVLHEVPWNTKIWEIYEFPDVINPTLVYVIEVVSSNLI